MLGFSGKIFPSHGIWVLNTVGNIKFIHGNSYYRYVCGLNSIKEAVNDSLKQFKRITIIDKKILQVVNNISVAKYW